MIEGYTQDCPLCRLVQDREIKTRLIFEDDLIIVVDCIVCRVPMAVLKAHRASFSDIAKDRLRKYFRRLLHDNPIPLAKDTILSKLYGGEYLVNNPSKTPWVIDWEQRQIPNHAHCHLRPMAFPGTGQWERIFK